MLKPVFYTPGGSQAIEFAKAFLAKEGVRFSDVPSKDVTHLLLGVPAFRDDGLLNSGGNISDILPLLRNDVTIIGGNLHCPALVEKEVVDLLQDPVYLSQNAQITAHCAVKVALSRLPVIFSGCPVLVIGWGRIGKCLASLLRGMGASVCVAARKPADRGILSALGYSVSDTKNINIRDYRVVFNTVPAPVLSQEALPLRNDTSLKIDLASQKGIACADVIWARGLPGKDAPESAGALIADSIKRLMI